MLFVFLEFPEHCKICHTPEPYLFSYFATRTGCSIRGSAVSDSHYSSISMAEFILTCTYCNTAITYFPASYLLSVIFTYIYCPVPPLNLISSVQCVNGCLNET